MAVQLRNQVVAAAASYAPAVALPLVVNGAIGVVLDINCTAITGTNIVFNLQAWDDAAQAWFTILSGASLTSAGRQSLYVHPAATTASNASLATGLRRRMQVLTSGTNTASTFSINAVYIPSASA